ncbi:DNA polymerase subunit Cdc27 [Dactylonectria macrodidyma]|uniref:DNA polymerase delta subunit 3 n=1 Tax=Dactylonectria macrodidyma TaxID=307937 RepID=A0A9P9FR46_9HYPO|nr:DNA polymerase subunit Cdc27 [Dactylonectria macrodidyma]
MDEHKKFLSDRLLGEERPVTYRLLSRALGVHVNTAKEMLYDFHKSRNALRADSIHATYLVYGTKSSDIATADGDVEMTSSMPDHDSLSEDVTTTTLALFREEELTDILAGYKQVTAIHVYSLAPFPQKDLSLLSDVATQLSEYSINEDASTAAKKYGTITNTQVRRRDRNGRSMAITPAAKPAKSESATPKPTPTPTAKVKSNPFAPKPAPVDTKPVKQEKTDSSAKDETPTSSAGKKPPALKKGNSGGIIQSFARAAALPPRPKPAPKKEEDTAMTLSDDGEADDTDLPAKKVVSDPGAVRAARKQREEALRRMMDDEEEEEEEDAEASEKDEEPGDEDMEEAPEPEPERELEAKEEKEPAEVVSSAGDGRRRGKRRVMKKKRILDEQGYMVTIQEPGWESFSEDEAPPPAKKQAVAMSQAQPQSSTPSSSAGKAKKPAGKGQGNIMSFFAKK